MSKRKTEVEAAVILHNWTTETLDKDSFIKLSKKPKDEQAAIVSARLTAIEKAERETFFEKGAIIVYVEKTELWKQIMDATGKPFHSFDAWMGSGGDTCRTSRYDARTWVMETADLPEEEVKKIARKNTKTFLKVPKHRRKDPKVLKAAQEKSKTGFIEYVQEKVPEAHVEPFKEMKFNLERSNYKSIDAVLVEAMSRYALESKEQALEVVCTDAKMAWELEDSAAKEQAKAAKAK